MLECFVAAVVLATACGGTPDEESVGLEDPPPSLSGPEVEPETQPGTDVAEVVPGEAEADDAAVEVEDDPGEAEADDAAVEVEDDPGEAEADDDAVAGDDPGEASAQDEEPAAEFPDDDFTAIATGAWHSCALREGGRAECWGSNPFGQAEAPEGPFSALAGGERHSCGLRLDGTVECWGNNEVGQTFAPTGSFTALSTGWGHSCGLRADGSIECWGINWDGRADPPEGRFSAVSAGDESSCGVRSDGSISCWGRLHEGQVPDGQFSAVAAGYRHSCAIRIDGTVTCWGDGQLGQTTPPEGRFESVAVGLFHSCGLTVDGGVDCWGDDWYGQGGAPPGRYEAIATGQLHSCGLASTGAVVCWGRNSVLGDGAPSGQFTAIDAGAIHLCGLRVDGSLSCTDGVPSHRLEIPEDGFTAVTTGGWYACGLRPDGVASCWGVDVDGETMVPPDPFSTVAAGGWHSCGVRTDGMIICWGSNEYGQSDAPGGQAVDVSVGGLHSCGVRSDGTITCWGENSYGQSNAPGGISRALAAGRLHSCGLRTDGIASCWGDNVYGQSDAPAVQFRAVTVDWDYSCGLLADGNIDCWGLAEVVNPPAGLVMNGAVTEGVVTEAEPPAYGGDCRPPGVQDGVTAGFPLPDWAPEPEGTLRVAVLFVDFDDAPADHTPQQEAELGLPFIEEVIQSHSYRRLDVEFVPLDRWLRAEHGHSHYLEDLLNTQAISADIDAEAVQLAAPYFDFDGIDTVMVVMPSSHLFGGAAGGWVDTGHGVEVPSLRLNAFPHDGWDGMYPWGWVGTHELMHILGLADMYPFEPVSLPELPGGETWVRSAFGMMSLFAYYRPTATDPVPTAVVHDADGSSRTESVPDAIASEMLAWSRWQLGWLDEDQVLCHNEPQASFGLAPVADPGRGIAMAAIPLSEYEVIVLESRRKMGLDLSYEDPLPGGGRIVMPGLLTEGVLVYTVDASILSGDMPVRLFDDTGDFQVTGYPILEVGDQVTVRGYKIAVVDDSGTTHTVTVSRTADG